MKFWFDTEFIEDGKTIDLISIGVVAEDGRTYYAENAECAIGLASDWVKQNVIVHLQGESAWRSRSQMARDLIEFMGDKPEIWAYYADYDWVALCQLFGTMMDLPKGWPMYCRDVKQLCDSLGNPKLPDQDTTEHHALTDAQWTRIAWQFLNARPEEADEATMPDIVAHTDGEDGAVIGWHVEWSKDDYAYCGDMSDALYETFPAEQREQLGEVNTSWMLEVNDSGGHNLLGRASGPDEAFQIISAMRDARALAFGRALMERKP